METAEENLASPMALRYTHPHAEDIECKDPDNGVWLKLESPQWDSFHTPVEFRVRRKSHRR